MTDDLEAGDTTYDGWYSADAATFGDRLAAAREAQNLSQTELARRLGVKLKTVKSWEDDVTEPRANKLQMTSGLLGVSMRWLLTGEGEGVAPPGEENETPAELAEVLRDMRALKEQLGRVGQDLGRLEKRLRNMMKEGA